MGGVGGMLALVTASAGRVLKMVARQRGWRGWCATTGDAGGVLSDAPAWMALVICYILEKL